MAKRQGKKRLQFYMLVTKWLWLMNISFRMWTETACKCFLVAWHSALRSGLARKQASDPNHKHTKRNRHTASKLTINKKETNTASKLTIGMKKGQQGQAWFRDWKKRRKNTHQVRSDFWLCVKNVWLSRHVLRPKFMTWWKFLLYTHPAMDSYSRTKKQISFEKESFFNCSFRGILVFSQLTAIFGTGWWVLCGCHV